jgi:hypothetical protein
VSADRLDFANPAALRAWLVDLRVAVDDAGAVTEDLLRPHRERDLGNREHARLYGDARAKLAALLSYADPPPEDNGAAPVH